MTLFVVERRFLRRFECKKNARYNAKIQKFLSTVEHVHLLTVTPVTQTPLLLRLCLYHTGWPIRKPFRMGFC